MCVISSMVGGGIAAGLMTALKAALAVAAIASTAVSTTTSIVNANNQAKAQQAQYNYQTQVNEQNAKIVQDNAARERQQGIEEARLQRIKASQVIGSQKTAMAANGVDITQGTALDVIEDTAAMGELDALQTRANYERKAQALETQAGNYKNQSALDTIAGQNAYSAGKMNGLAAGLNGISKAADVASKWFDFGSSKTTNGINWGISESGFKIATQGNSVYAGLGTGLT